MIIPILLLSLSVKNTNLFCLSIFFIKLSVMAVFELYLEQFDFKFEHLNL
jgi:hypothetical protein